MKQIDAKDDYAARSMDINVNNSTSSVSAASSPPISSNSPQSPPQLKSNASQPFSPIQQHHHAQASPIPIRVSPITDSTSNGNVEISLSSVQATRSPSPLSEVLPSSSLSTQSPPNNA